jgi:hypothetical protein
MRVGHQRRLRCPRPDIAEKSAHSQKHNCDDTRP